jgi:F0F1-type ATP synthase membrane subunit b/b'
MVTKKPNGKVSKTKVGLGAITAAALAVAGGYVLWENMGKERQKKVKTWVADARKEAAKNLAKAKKVTQAEYKTIVDKAVKHYGKIHEIDATELAKTADQLKNEWERIRKQAGVVAEEIKKLPKGGKK